MFEGKHSDLTEKIIGAFYQVCGQLGYGFSEKVYENALTLLLKKMGLENWAKNKAKGVRDTYFKGQFKL